MRGAGRTGPCLGEHKVLPHVRKRALCGYLQKFSYTLKGVSTAGHKAPCTSTGRELAVGFRVCFFANDFRDFVCQTNSNSNKVARRTEEKGRNEEVEREREREREGEGAAEHTSEHAEEHTEGHAGEHAKEHAAKEHAAKEHAAEEHAPEEHSAEEHSAKEHAAKEHIAGHNSQQTGLACSASAVCARKMANPTSQHKSLGSAVNKH